MKGEIDNLSMYYFFVSLEIPFRCGRINMWSKEDIYDYIPNFKFKFLEMDKSKYYFNLIEIVNKFKGNLQWEIITKPNYSNHILKPKNIDNYIKTDINYKTFIEASINDVPLLIEHLKNNKLKINQIPR